MRGQLDATFDGRAANQGDVVGRDDPTFPGPRVDVVALAAPLVAFPMETVHEKVRVRKEFGLAFEAIRVQPTGVVVHEVARTLGKPLENELERHAGTFRAVEHHEADADAVRTKRAQQTCTAP